MSGTRGNRRIFWGTHPRIVSAIAIVAFGQAFNAYIWSINSRTESNFKQHQTFWFGWSHRRDSNPHPVIKSDNGPQFGPNVGQGKEETSMLYH